MKKSKTILIAPLNWGLGHATRIVPIINLSLKLGFNVIIAADGYPLEFLKKEFPNLEYVILKSSPISYGKSKNQVFKILSQTPKFISSIFKEHKQLKKIINENEIDIVISDNRYGLWNKDVYSIFITHQLMIKMPKGFKYLEPVSNRLLKSIIKKYNSCWIPDIKADGGLSGELSHKYRIPQNTKFIGSLSRFSTPEKDIDKKYDILAIVSGPEPQRSIFEDILFKQLKATSLKCVILSGKPAKDKQSDTSGNVTTISHLETDELEELILSSNHIICRSGYSSVMDMVKLKKDAIMIPTPGQTEQEYLAEYLFAKKIFYTTTQENFEIEKALLETQKFSNSLNIDNTDILTKELKHLSNMGYK